MKHEHRFNIPAAYTEGIDRYSHNRMFNLTGLMCECGWWKVWNGILWKWEIYDPEERGGK